MSPDFRLIQAFVAVLEERSFTRAADRLHIGQSGLSQQIKKLERLVGGELFDRSGRVIEVTELGAALYQPAQHVLASLEHFERTAGLASERDVLRLAIAENGVNGLAIELLADIRAAFPVTDLQLERVSLIRQHEAIDGEIDAVIARPPYAEPIGHETIELPLAEDPVVLSVHESSAVAARSTISASEVETLERMSLPWLPDTWAVEYPVFNGKGDAPGPGTESFRQAIVSISVDRAACVMPRSFAKTYNVPDVITIPIDGLEPMRIVLLAQPPGEDSMADRIVAAVQRRPADTGRSESSAAPR